MKYLINNDNILDFYDKIFTCNANINTIALINSNSDIIFNNYDVFIKFKVLQQNQMLLNCDIRLLENKSIFIDGKVYTRDDIHELAQTKDYLSENDKLNYKDIWCAGRVCFPFDEIGSEHIMALKGTVVGAGYIIHSGNGGNIYPNVTDIAFLNNVNTYCNGMFSTSNNMKIYMSNIDSNDANSSFVYWLSNNFGDPSHAPKYLELPLNMTVIPGYAFRYAKLETCNFLDLKNIETLGEHNFEFNTSQITEGIDIDMSQFTKLRVIENNCFQNKLINSLVLPPNLEYLSMYNFRSCTFNDCIVEIPESLKTINYAFYETLGTLTLKFKSSNPPSEIGDYSGSSSNPTTMNSFSSWATTGSNHLKIMVPRGSAEAYWNAFGTAYTYTEALNYGYVENKLIEYDPE